MTTAALQDPDAQIEAEIAAALERGDDPYTGPGEAPKAPEGQAAPADQAPGNEGAQEDAEQASVETLEAIAYEEPEVIAQPLQFNAQIPQDYKATRAALLAEKAEAMSKLMDGQLDAAEYAAVESRVMDSLEELSAQRIRAETLIEANQQTQAQAQQAAITALIQRSKASGEIQYLADPKAQRQFDMALTAVGSDPDNENKPFEHLVNEAHKVVLALRGVQAKTPSAESTKPDRSAPTPPVTLSGLPTAATSGASSPSQIMAKLTGDDFEKAYDALPEAERAKMLR